MDKKTQWFPADVKPKHEGLYETRADGTELTTWSLWIGHWTPASTERKWAIAQSRAGGRSFWQDRRWRGLDAPVERGGE